MDIQICTKCGAQITANEIDKIKDICVRSYQYDENTRNSEIEFSVHLQGDGSWESSGSPNPFFAVIRTFDIAYQKKDFCFRCMCQIIRKLMDDCERKLKEHESL